MLTGIVLLTLDFRGVEPIDRAQEQVRDLLNPLRGAAESVTEPFRDAWRGIFEYDDIEAENHALRERVAELEAAELATEAEEQTLERLLAQVELPYAGDLPKTVARVARGPTGNFGSDVIEINKGQAAGVAENMAVVTSAGLVGSVIQADRSASLVRLIHDPTFEVGVRVASSGDPGLASGTGEPSLMKLRFVDEDVELTEGDPVVTVGPEGQSRFPADIPVGRVSLGDDVEGAPLLGVAPAADPTRLDFVSVILFLPEVDADAQAPSSGASTSTTEESGS